MYEISDSLDKNWSKEIILSKIKNGQSLENIVNQFLRENKSDIKEFLDQINLDNYKVLDNLISLHECDLKLIKKLKDLETKNKKNNHTNLNEKEIKIDLSLFMNKWSNKFVIITLITISLISLTKQAWA